jgi:hypothetical protein
MRIKVYVGTEADGTIVDESIDATDNITIDVPSGEARVFKVYGSDSTGSLIYSGASTPIDLVGGKDTNVSISLGAPEQKAVFSVKLLAEDGISDFADPGYLEDSGNKFTADVYRPTINTTPEPDEVVLGATIDSVSNTSFVTSLSGLNAYASTPQIVVVRAFTLDGTIAAIGIAAFADLSDGTNSTPIPVVMSRPGRIILNNTSPITTVKVEMEIGGTGGLAYYKEVATSGISTNDSLNPYAIIIAVPNNRINIGLNTGGIFDGPAPRNLKITVNGESKAKVVALGWDAYQVNFPTW